ncbi:unnamed protein product [Callosobruchus maculatus]|uniref:Uncharacterized protein n=1 Tax=Callosobruchus maculatus TaxID=64391 RepID=A0A653CDI0_CALMS|nr:unnamed protein product [Callosobruchus maculatus]
MSEIDYYFSGKNLRNNLRKEIFRVFIIYVLLKSIINSWRELVHFYIYGFRLKIFIRVHFYCRLENGKWLGRQFLSICEGVEILFRVCDTLPSYIGIKILTLVPAVPVGVSLVPLKHLPINQGNKTLNCH